MSRLQPNSSPEGDRVSEEPVAARRCWRCLKMFDCDRSELPVGPPEWWLCETCQEQLLPAAKRPR